MRPSSVLFASLSSKINEISRLSGIPGVSVGVIDNGEIVHTASYGFCDVENKVPCDDESVFVLGSLSKAFTATLLANLVEDGRLEWSTPVSKILPEYKRDSDDLSSYATIADLLSHRAGLSNSDSLWLGSDNVPLLNHSDAVEVFSSLPQQSGFRDSFIYNNFAYDVLGHVIEKLSASSYSSFLHNRLLRPLGMNRTYYTDDAGQIKNEAKAYAALKNATPIEIAPALAGEDVLIGPAGGVRSCVRDLLAFYDALMDAADDQMEVTEASTLSQTSGSSVLPQISAMWTGWNILPMPWLREHSYGFGWLRAQLPNVLTPSRGIPKLNPLVGVGAPSRLALWHSGDIPGYQTHATLFPETKQAIVVLTNSLSLNDGARFINNLLIEALLDNLDNAKDYVEIAKITAEMGASRAENIQKELRDSATHLEPCQPLRAYAGRYFDNTGNFFIDILIRDAALHVSFMGRSRDTFKLKSYGEDSFFWVLTHDLAASLARYTGYGRDFFILEFTCEGKCTDSAHTLWWKHGPFLPRKNQEFVRAKSDKRMAYQEKSMEL